MRHRYIVKHKKDSVWDFIKAAHDAWSGWLCVFLVGLAAGTYFFSFVFYSRHLTLKIDRFLFYFVHLRNGRKYSGYWNNVDDRFEVWYLP